MKKLVKKIRIRGSATLIVIIASFVVMLYAQSTYASIQHMKSMYNTQEEDILTTYEQEYNDSFDLLEE